MPQPLPCGPKDKSHTLKPGIAAPLLRFQALTEAYLAGGQALNIPQKLESLNQTCIIAWSNGRLMVDGV